MGQTSLGEPVNVSGCDRKKIEVDVRTGETKEKEFGQGMVNKTLIDNSQV